MKKAVFFLMVLTIVSKMIGFLRDVTLSYFYGASGISDAYLISLTIPGVIFGVIATGISTGYIPMYSRIQEADGEKKSLFYTNNLVNALLVFCTLIIIGGLVFTEPLVKLFAFGFKGEQLETAVVLTRISIIGIYFTLLIRVLSGYLNLKKLFQVPNLLGIPMNIIVIFSIIFSYYTNIVVILAVGHVSALFVQFLILLYFSHKKGYTYQSVLDVKDTYLKNMLLIAIPVILGSAVTQINKLVDRTLASQISVGGISALNYAHTLTGFVQGVFVASISTVMYPHISKMASVGDMMGLKKNLSQAMIGIIVLVIPATAGSLFFAEPIVRSLFGRGAFDTQAADLTADAFFYYSIGMIGLGLRVVLSRAFYSLQDTRTPMINGAIAMGLNIVLNIILSRYLGIGGLALATSISAIFATLLLLVSLRKKTGNLGLRNILITFGKIVIASFGMAVAAKLLYSQLTIRMGDTFPLIISLIAAVILYSMIVYFMRIKEVDDIVSGVKKKLSSRKNY